MLGIKIILLIAILNASMTSSRPMDAIDEDLEIQVALQTSYLSINRNFYLMCSSTGDLRNRHATLEAEKGTLNPTHEIGAALQIAPCPHRDDQKEDVLNQVLRQCRKILCVNSEHLKLNMKYSEAVMV